MIESHETYRASDKSKVSVAGKAEITIRERNKWSELDDMGTFMLIDKCDLQLDLSYQRDSNSRGRILRIAREFDWKAFGALSVAMREDGFFVTDGGNRLRAVELRDDIQKVPCMVFDCEGVEDEANAFLAQNTLHKTVSPYHKFRAKLVAKDPVALMVQSILDSHDYRFVPHAKTGRVTSAVAAMMDAAAKDMTAFRVTLDLCVEIADGDRIPVSPFRGLFYLITNGCEKIATTTYRRKLVYEGMDKLNREIYRAKHLHNTGGYVVEAKTLLQIVNKGRRTRKLALKVEGE